MKSAPCIAKTGRAPALCVGLALVAGVLLAACAPATRVDGTGPGERSVERPRAAVSDLEPVQMLMSRGTPTDSDGNGFPDTIPVVVYLFPDARESDLPIWSMGAFRFEISSADGRPVGRWEFGDALAERARVRLAPGPGYSFFLRLGPGEDRLPPINAELRASFVHESGRVLDTSGAATLRLGVARAVGESS